MEKKNTFGEYFRNLRIAQGITLRRFCQENGYDPGNVSKIERGVFTAPLGQDKLEDYASALKIQEGSEAWIQFFDLATISNKTLDLGKIKDEALLRKLPILFRTLENKELTEEELDQLVETIKNS